MLAVSFLACSLHLGRPSAPVASVGEVVAPAGEIGLEGALRQALAAQVTGDGVAVHVRVVSSEVVPVAAGGRAMEARLTAELEQGERRVQVAGTRVFEAPDPLTAEAARRQAFSALAEILVRDGLLLLEGA